MSGYRTSRYDPTHYERMAPPLRPFNWVQWTGVALFVVGMTLYVLVFAGRFGWMRPLIAETSPGFALNMVGIVLLNSRRQPAPDPASELAAARKRWLLITVAIVAAILGAATVIEFTGA